MRGPSKLYPVVYNSQIPAYLTKHLGLVKIEKRSRYNVFISIMVHDWLMKNCQFLTIGHFRKIVNFQTKSNVYETP